MTSDHVFSPEVCDDTNSYSRSIPQFTNRNSFRRIYNSHWVIAQCTNLQKETDFLRIKICTSYQCIYCNSFQYPIFFKDFAQLTCIKRLFAIHLYLYLHITSIKTIKLVFFICNNTTRCVTHRHRRISS